MPHWEVILYLQSFNRLIAQVELRTSEAVALGSGTISDEFQREKILVSLRKSALGITPEEEEIIRNKNKNSWTKELQQMMKDG